MQAVVQHGTLEDILTDLSGFLGTAICSGISR